MQQFRTQTETVVSSGKVESNCADITFYNIGTEPVAVEGVPVLPGGAFGISGNAGELNVTQYTVVFAGGGIPALVVIRKNYI